MSNSCDLMDCSLPGSSVYGILQGRILGWLPFPSPGEFSDPGFEPKSPALQADSSTSEPPGKSWYSTTTHTHTHTHTHTYIYTLKSIYAYTQFYIQIYSMEELMMMKLQYLGHLMQRADSLEKTLMLGKTKGRRRRAYRGRDGWMALPTWWTWVWASSRSWWGTERPGMLQSMRL